MFGKGAAPRAAAGREPGVPLPPAVPARMRRLILGSLTPLLLALLAAPALGQGFSTTNGRNHPEIDWREAETAHFRILYPAHLAGIETEAGAIAEASYAALSSNLGVTFDRKIRIYLSDEDEVVNGFAAPLREGYTAIWVGQNGVADVWTGGDKWLRRVIPHELAHIFHYRATRSNVGVFGYALSNPTPRFWTEGLAQYQTEAWDAERGERYLRTAALEGRLSSDDGASAWNGRLLYALGNAQVRFFAAQRGDSALARLLAHRSRAFGGLVRYHDLAAAFPAVTGESYGAFYERWRRHVSTQLGARAAGFEPPESLGVRRPFAGQYLYGVQPGPDTARAALVRLVSLDRPVRQLAVAGVDGRVLAEGAVEAPVAWSPSGALVAFAKTGRAAHGSLVNDLYLAGSRGEGVRRLTRGRRASDPTFAPDGRRIAFAGSAPGPAGATTNVFVIDTETGREVQASRLEGDVQIQGLAWRPVSDVVGVEEVAVALFEPDGTRAIFLLDLATGARRPLTEGAHDDRAPVWSPDGERLAYTSLRDGVPNVFVFSVETGLSERVTRAAQGATATAWLPSDSAHAAGQLVVVTSVSKTHDEVYYVDAARRAPEPVDLAPAALTAWERHRPPATVPRLVAAEPGLVERRGRYRSLANLTHVVSLPFPYVDNGGKGVGGFTVWLEPLGRHALYAVGGLSFHEPLRRSFFALTYRNATLAPTLTLNVFNFPRSGRLYGPDVIVERLTGAEVSARLPLNVSRAYAAAQFEGKLRLVRSDTVDADRFALLADGLRPPESGTQATLTLGFARKAQRPWRDASIHPLDGHGLRLAATGGLGLDRPTRFVRGDVAAYAILPALGLQRLFVYGRAQAQTGRVLPQDYLGLSRHDALQLAIPAVLPLRLDRNERVRGYRRYAVGQSVLFGSAEYRVPIAADLNTSLFGVVRHGAASVALFADAAVVGQDARFKDAIRRTGVGAEVKNVVRVSGVGFGQSLGVAQRATHVFGKRYELYYRIRMGVPF